MAEKSFPVLTGVANPRATTDGTVIIVALQFGDGSTKDVAVHTALFPQLLNELRGFAGLAEAARQKIPGDAPQEELIAPYRVTSVNTASAKDGHVVLKTGTGQGMPVLLAFTVDQAKDAAAKLAASARTSQEKTNKLN